MSRTSYFNYSILQYDVEGSIVCFSFQELQDAELSSTSELCDICQVSSIRFIIDETFEKPVIRLESTHKPLCKRCRRHPENEGTVCARCAEILSAST